MKTLFTLASLGLLISFFSSGCSPVLYSTVGQNVPMFTEKNEFSGSIGFASSTGDDVTDADGVSLTAAYSISDKWAGIMSLYSMKNATSPIGDDWDSKGSYFELGGGRYGTFMDKWMAYEVFGGIGFGNIKNAQQNHKIDVGFTKLFLQPSIGVISPYFDAIFTPRIAFVGYNKKDVVTNNVEYRTHSNSFFEEQAKNAFVFEPGITLRGGYKNVKLSIQYTYSTFKDNYNDGQFYPVNNEFLNIGLNFLISNRYKPTEALHL